jgi:predicted MPP superfamily phosphohydrolase
MKTFKHTTRGWIRSVLYFGLAVIGRVGYFSSKRLEIVHANVPLVGLPKRFEGLKIAVMSDFHSGAFITREKIMEAVHIVNKERPDIVTLLGDYVDGAHRNGHKNFENRCYIFDALKKLKAPHGIYAVLGNNDHKLDAYTVRNKLSSLPLVILHNRSIRLDNNLALAGVDDLWRGRSQPIRAIKDLSPDSVVIMLSHNPDVNILLREDDRVKLVLSGHTHGGQIRIPLTNRALWVPCSRKYRGVSGLLRETEQRWTFITKGVGTSISPVRIACPPDIGILRLMKS